MVPKTRIGEWAVEPELNTLRRGHKRVRVEAKTMQVLAFLADHPGEVFSRERIIEKVWSEAFVTDGVLWNSISELRRVFGDDPKNPAYIETVPRLGYRLIARVAVVDESPEGEVRQEGTAAVPRVFRRGFSWAAACSAVILVFAGSMQLTDRTESKIESKDTVPWYEGIERTTVLVARLDNRTGEELLDGTLEAVLKERLKEWGQLDLVSPKRVQEALGWMQLPENSEISEELARSVSLGDPGIDWLVTGQIDPLGKGYRLSIQLLDARSNEFVASTARETGMAEGLFFAAEDLSDWVLGQLQIADLSQSQTTPSEQVTANSDALISYTLGMEAYISSQTGSPEQRAEAMASAETLFLDAIRIDREFAPAQLMLAVNRKNLDLIRRAPVTRFQVRFAIDPVSPFNIVPDGKGFFQGGGCWPPDCPYVDHENGFRISEMGNGEFRLVQQYDRDAANLYGGSFHYRYFETDIEYQAINADLCPSLIDLARGFSLGGSYHGETMQRVRFSLWLDAWPKAEQSEIRTAGDALVLGMVHLENEAGPVSYDFDDDGELDALLDTVKPRWRLEWDEQNFRGSSNLRITREADGFRVASLGAAMLRIHHRPGEGLDAVNCGLVDARFEFVATPIPSE